MSYELAVGGREGLVSLVDVACPAVLRQMAFERLERGAGRGTIGAVFRFSGLNAQASYELAWRLEHARVEPLFAPHFIYLAGHRIKMRSIERHDLIQIDLPRFSGRDYRFKRAFDVVFAGAAPLALSPVLVAIAIALKLDRGVRCTSGRSASGARASRS